MLISVCRLEFPRYSNLQRLSQSHLSESRVRVRGPPFAPFGYLMVAGPVGRPS